jgi:hypothetical protein
MRLFPDVMVEPDGDEEWIAMGREAAVPGETLILDIAPRGTNELHHRLPVRVIESRPVILDGDLRYRIRLHSDMAAPVLFEQQIRRG